MARSNMARVRVIAKVFIASGALFAIVGAGFLIDSIQFTQRADIIVARVIENPSHRSTSSGNSSTLYQPIFSFTDADGHEVIAQIGMSSSSFNYRVNSEVKIYHVRGSSPPRIRIASFGGLWAFGSIFLIIGVGSMGMGALVLRSMREPKPDEDTGLQAPPTP